MKTATNAISSDRARYQQVSITTEQTLVRGDNEVHLSKTCLKKKQKRHKHSENFAF